MAEIINLNKARKRRQREADEKQAAENRVKFGRSKTEKQRDAAEAEEARRRLDQLRRESPPEPRAQRPSESEPDPPRRPG
ncbi:MAG: DUF4169 family protein [Stenotrophobium sp.]